MAWRPGGGLPQGGGNVPVLKPTELFEKRKNRDSSRLKAYNTILEQIYARVLTASRTGTDSFLLYTVPPFILGLPRLDLEDCIIYIVYQLRQQGYEVRYTYPNLLFINWTHHEKEYIHKQSPIMQAMAPAHTDKKQQVGRVRFADEVRGTGAQPVAQQVARGSAAPQEAINYILSQKPTAVGAPARAPPRNINDYKPPVSFLDAIERPINAAATKKDVINDLWNF
jgi:hypothetical protein